MGCHLVCLLRGTAGLRDLLLSEANTVEGNMTMRLMIIGLGLVYACMASVCDACSVCMGDPEAPMTRGMFAGIGVLLAVTACVLASFGAFFIYLMRRASRMHHLPGMSEAG